MGARFSPFSPYDDRAVAVSRVDVQECAGCGARWAARPRVEHCPACGRSTRPQTFEEAMLELREAAGATLEAALEPALVRLDRLARTRPGRALIRAGDRLDAWRRR